MEPIKRFFSVADPIVAVTCLLSFVLGTLLLAVVAAAKGVPGMILPYLWVLAVASLTLFVLHCATTIRFQRLMAARLANNTWEERPQLRRLVA